MPVPAQKLELLEAALGAPVEVAIAAHPPGANRKIAAYLAIGVLITIVVGWLVYRLTGYIVVSLLPLVLVAAVMTRRKKSAEPSSTTLPLSVLAIVTTTEFVLATWETTASDWLGPIVAQVPRDQVASVEPLGSKEVRIGFTDGRTFLLVVARRGDRQPFVESLARAARTN
jgi:hypothetical protein